MKKTVIVTIFALMSGIAVCAQESMSEEARTKAIAERIGKSAERMAKEFKLEDEAKKAFINVYTDYQKEMFATNQSRGQRSEQAESSQDKELSDEEATAKIKENLDRQEQQIATLQKRLEVQKKYCEEFAKVLTPQQVLKVLTPQRSQNGREQMQRRNGDGERRGGFEGGNPRGSFGGGPRGGFGGGF